MKIDDTLSGSPVGWDPGDWDTGLGKEARMEAIG